MFSKNIKIKKTHAGGCGYWAQPLQEEGRLGWAEPGRPNKQA